MNRILGQAVRHPQQVTELLHVKFKVGLGLKPVFAVLVYYPVLAQRPTRPEQVGFQAAFGFGQLIFRPKRRDDLILGQRFATIGQ